MSYSVLVADDEGPSRRLLSEGLKAEGFEVEVARDGNEAWALLQRDGAPQIAILDWCMPGLDGIEICRRVRERDEPRYTYILLLSALGDHEHVRQGLSSGADGYVAKPFDLPELVERVRAACRVVDRESALYEAQAELQAEHESQAAELAALSVTDDLTGLHNRRGFVTLAEQHARVALRRGDSFSIAFMDLDGLKIINDNLGHDAGDEALREAADLFRATLREADILARLGGDEFVALLDCSPDQVDAVFERLKQELDNLAEQPNRRYRLSVSTGAASFDPEQPASIDHLLGLADQRMYAQKRARRTDSRPIVLGLPPGAITDTRRTWPPIFSSPPPASRRSPSRPPNSPSRPPNSPSQSPSSPSQRHTSPSQSPSSPSQRHTSPSQSPSSPSQRHTSPSQSPSSPSNRQTSPSQAPSSPQAIAPAEAQHSLYGPPSSPHSAPAPSSPFAASTPFRRSRSNPPSSPTSVPFSKPPAAYASMFRWPSGKAEQLTHHLLGAWSVRRPDGFAHAHRLAAYAEIFARALGASPDEAEKLAQLAALHDIGELALPDSILFNTGKLTLQEKALKRRHTSFGRELLSATPSLFGVAAATVAYHHHERWDGSGYPDALVGEACPREARIIGILDAYDTLRGATAQPNHLDEPADLDDDSLTHYFREHRGRHFDPFLVDALLETVADLRLLVPRFPTVQLRAPAP